MYSSMLLRQANQSRRHLVLRHAEDVARYHRGEPPLYSDDSNVKLDPGEEILYSFFRPSLPAGQYNVDVQQPISASGESKTLESSREFRVTGPRFAFEEGDVVSSYPPSGHGDQANILPHVVLDDPHMPWVRLGTLHEQPVDNRNSVPWLALLVFTPEELKVDDSFLTPLGKKLEQGASMAVEMTLEDVWDLQNRDMVVTPYITTDPETIDPETKTNFVFLRPQEFTALFRRCDSDGVPVKDQSEPDTTRYKYLSHVRGINTQGITDAQPIPQRLYSLAISHRTPPVNVSKPTPVVVHLVSIEHVEDKITWPVPDNKRIGLVSLHSWTYVCLPPDLSLQDRLRHLGNTIEPLRASDPIIDKIGDTAHPEHARIYQRLKDRATDGFTLIRYRLQTGEESVAFTRSPFIPANTKLPLPNLPRFSVSSTDLQVLDPDLGIMDLTYSTAWQLGKTLAVADKAFCAAVVRLRLEIYRRSVAATKMEFMRANARGGFTTKEETVRAVPELIKSISNLHENTVFTTVGTNPNVSTLAKRWSRPRISDYDLSTMNPALMETFDKHCVGVVEKLSGAADGVGFYNELNAPLSTDWMLMLKWLMDVMFLNNVPMHYLVPDSMILPEESFRFFSIDQDWIMTLVDGALSVGNHFSREWDSKIRGNIKERLSKYLDTIDPETHYKPQKPTHGFLLRSKLVQQFPALSVRAPHSGTDLRAPILRQEILTDGTMLCLFDREPGSSDFKSLTIQLPPHQQRFTIAEELTENRIQISFKKVYTTDAPKESYGALPVDVADSVWKATGETKPLIYDWESRTLIFPTWPTTVFNTIKKGMEKLKPGSFTDDKPTAALIGIQQNDPLYEMSIISPDASYCTIQMAFGPQAELLHLHVPPPLENKATSSIPRALTPQTAVDPIRCYDFGVWPIDDIGADFIPTNLGYPIDLVFKVVRKDNLSIAASEQILHSIWIGLPREATTAITENYDGPGGKMVSNSRWNFSFTEQDSYINIEVKPRSLSLTSPVHVNDEISVILKQVNIIQRDRPVTSESCQILFTENYGEKGFVQDWVRYKLQPRHEM